jgi:hypothetical protein
MRRSRQATADAAWVLIEAGERSTCLLPVARQFELPERFNLEIALLVELFPDMALDGNNLELFKTVGVRDRTKVKRHRPQKQPVRIKCRAEHSAPSPAYSLDLC